MTEIHKDMVTAAAKLVDRSGGRQFEIGHAGAGMWWASALFLGAKVMTDGHQTPSSAALALSEKLLTEAMCRCGQKVTLDAAELDRCRWQLIGDTWTPGCDTDPIRMAGVERGDIEAMSKRLTKR